MDSRPPRSFPSHPRRLTGLPADTHPVRPSARTRRWPLRPKPRSTTNSPPPCNRAASNQRLRNSPRTSTARSGAHWSAIATSPAAGTNRRRGQQRCCARRMAERGSFHDPGLPRFESSARKRPELSANLAPSGPRRRVEAGAGERAAAADLRRRFGVRHESWKEPRSAILPGAHRPLPRRRNASPSSSWRRKVPAP